MLVRDIELEQMNPKQAREYIGRKARKQTPFQPVTLPQNCHQLNITFWSNQNHG